MARATTKTDLNQGGNLQMSFFEPESDWTPTPVSQLPSWDGAKRIAIDCETRDPLLTKMGPGTMRGDAYTTGWGFSIEGGPKYYLPIRHEQGGNLPIEEVMRYLREQVKNFKGEYVGANLQYDVDFGYNDGFEWNQDAMFRDIQIADPLIYELHMSYSLANIGKRVGIEAKKDDMLIEAARSFGLDPKKGMWRLHSKYVGAYAEQDVTSPLEIYERQRKTLDEKNLWQVFDLETKVLPVLVRMSRRGVRIDQDKLAQIEEWAVREEHEAARKIKSITGHDIGFGNFMSANACAPALESIGIRLKKTSTGAPQIDRFLLGGHDHEVTNAILKARKVNKIRTTFADSIWRYMVNGRIHNRYHQIAREDEAGDQKGVRYGRLSAVHPNLQQQPSPDRDPETAGEWRKIFIPEEGQIWACNDYSQQEPRWTTHFAAVLDLPKARVAAERYVNDPSTDNHEMMTRLVHGDEQVEKWMQAATEFGDKNFKVFRGYCKNIYLGVCYGEGGAKLAHDLGLPTRWAHITGWGRDRRKTFYETQQEAMEARMESEAGYYKEEAGEEAQQIMDKFDAEAPFIRQLADKASERAESRGYVSTIMGRKLNFEMRDNGSYDYTHKALNRVIQGSSGDQTKLAIVEIDRAGHFLQLQVHDETNCSVGSIEEGIEVGRIMSDCILDVAKPMVPFKVDTECGPSWGEIKDVSK